MPFLWNKISYFHFVSQKDGCLLLNMPSAGSTQFFHTPLTILVITRSVCYYKVVYSSLHEVGSLLCSWFLLVVNIDSKMLDMLIIIS